MTNKVGPLKNGNPRGNPNSAPRCGAHSRRTGKPCRAPAIKNGNGRCRMHNGKPFTAEAIERIRAANLKHGKYTAMATEIRRELQEFTNDVREIRKQMTQANIEKPSGLGGS